MSKSGEGVPNWAVVFDIDGVLLRDGAPIANALDALNLLPQYHQTLDRTPHAFVTNGGGYIEDIKAKNVSHSLGISVTSDKVIVCHTPLRNQDVSSFGRVLLVAHDNHKALEVLRDYGIPCKDTLHDYSNSNQWLWPTIHAGHENNHASASKATQGFDTVILLGEPREWGEALQILCDVTRSSNGTPGGPDLAVHEKQHVRFIVCNPDFEYGGRWSVPRFTVGAFVRCLSVLFADVLRGRKLECEYYGKPYAATYRCAETLLQEQYEKLLQVEVESQLGAQAETASDSQVTCGDRQRQTKRARIGDGGHDPAVTRKLGTIYAIGDNPLSDIKGANEAGDRWVSILVRTGVHQSEENDLANPANHFCQNVTEAIQYILDRESSRSV